MPSVKLHPYCKSWASAFEEVRTELHSIFLGTSIEVQHVGSTSVPSLSAKPVLDILLGASSLEEIESRITALEESGFEYRHSYEQNIPDRRYFVRQTLGAMRVHLHAVVIGHQIWHDHIYFRDSLLSDPPLRSEYQSLKSHLAITFRDDKDAYTAAKAPFVQMVLSRRKSNAG